MRRATMATMRRKALAVAIVVIALGAEAGEAHVVTVATTLAGEPVHVDVHAPAGAPRGAVVLAHGFMRSRATMAGHA